MAASPWMVTIATGTSSTTCAARHALAETLQQVPKITTKWVSEGAIADAHFADGTWTVSLKEQTGRHPRLTTALRKAWPTDRAALPPRLVPPPYEPLALACAGKVARAYATAGAAASQALAEVAAPAAAPPGAPLMHRWAYARAKAAAESKGALDRLREVEARITRGEIGPTWRIRTDSEDSPAVSTADGLVLLFDNGTFEARDIVTGQRLWRRSFSAAEPHMTTVRPGMLLTVLPRAVEALDARTGMTLWRSELKRPRAEVAVKDGLLFIADNETVQAIHLDSGETKWTYDGLLMPVAGPVVVGNHIAAPMGPRVAILRREDGREERVIDLRDELSAPLITTETGGVWAMVGSDEAVFIGAGLERVDKRFDDVPGAAWPAARLDNVLVLVMGDEPDRGHLVYIDPKRRTRRIARRIPTDIESTGTGDGARLVHLDARRRALVARDRRGRIAWTARMKAPIRTWTIAGDAVVVASDRALRWLSIERGAVQRIVELNRPVERIAINAHGGAAVLDDGTVYGLAVPTDPRVAPLLQRVRLTLARAHLATGQLTAARRMAAAAINGSANDFEALVLRAKLASRQKKAVVESWLGVLAARPDDPTLVAKATEHMRKAGLTEVLDLGASGVRTSSTWVAVRTPRGVEGRNRAELSKVAWSAADAELGPVRGSAVRVGDRWLELSTGRPLEAGRRPVASGVFIRGTSDGTVLERTDSRPWSKPLAPGLSAAKVGGERIVLFGDQRAAVWSMDTGQTLWSRARPSSTLDAWAVGDTVLLRTRNGLHAVDASTGKQRYRVAVREGAPVVIIARQAVYAEGEHIKFLEIGKGRLRGTTKLSAPVLGLWSAAGRLFAGLGSGAVVALDPRRRRAIGSANVGFRDGAVLGEQSGYTSGGKSGGEFAVVDRSGRLLIFDARRSLRR